MKKVAFRLPVTALLAVALTAGIAFAKTSWDDYTHPESKLEFKVPSNWKVEQDGDLLTATNPKGDLAAFFFVAAQQDADAFFNEIAKELDSMLKDVTISQEPTESKINGLTQIFVEGSGTIDGETVDFDLTYVVGGKKPMVVLCVGKIQPNQKLITEMYGYIKKAK